MKEYGCSLDEVDEVSVFSYLRCCLVSAFEVCVVLLFPYQFPLEHIMNERNS